MMLLCKGICAAATPLSKGRGAVPRHAPPFRRPWLYTSSFHSIIALIIIGEINF